MLTNPYLYHKMVQQHDRELVREAEQQRMLAELPHFQSPLIQYVARRFAAFRVRLLFFTKHMKQEARTATGQL
jgi:hypothetical protein